MKFSDCYKSIIFPLLICLTCHITETLAQVKISTATKSPEIDFAISEIKSALVLQPIKQNIELIFIADSAKAIATATKNQFNNPEYFGWQTFSIRKKANQIYVLASEPTGAMYAGLEIAQRIKNVTLSEIQNSDNEPYLERRGIKFNIPLDLRTPSYSDISTISQANIPDVWDIDFWKTYFDEMARRKFNVMTWWSLNPFPSMVNVPEFPDVSLDDVWRTKAPLDDNFPHNGKKFIRPEMLANHEVVKKIKMADKVRYWQQVMQAAKDRGIEIYIYTWNIFSNAAEGKYGINDNQDNQQTIKYFRYATRELVKDYPLLKGLGITAGEGMQKLEGEFSNENWLWKTYGEGINDALKEDPKRDFTLIHRFHWASLGEIKEAFRAYPSKIQLCLKYSIAHMYAIPNPPFSLDAFPLLSKDLKSWITLRNDDVYNMRWANIDYARSFIKAIPEPDKVAGFNMGPDGYVWGRDYISTTNNHQLIFKKQWASNMLWGELGYNPNLPDSLLQHNIEAQFKNTDNKKLLKAWSAASMIFPLTTRFCWGDIDLKWFPEANFSHKKSRGFWSIKDYMEVAPVTGSNISDILTWADNYFDNKKDSLISPLEEADSISRQSQLALQLLKELGNYNINSGNEKDQTMGDIEIFGHLGNYYAEKIKASAYLALYNKYKIEDYQQEALFHINNALNSWKKYASLYTTKYKPALYNRVGFVDAIALTKEVEKDVETIKNWKPGNVKLENKFKTEKPFRE